MVQKVVAVPAGDSIRVSRPSNGEYMWPLCGGSLQQLSSFHRANIDEFLIAHKNQVQLVGASGTHGLVAQTVHADLLLMLCGVVVL